MSDDEARCKLCHDIAIHEHPTVLCDHCFVEWLKEGDWVIDQGCPVADARFDAHVDGCDLCCTYENDFDYCPIGESLQDAWLDTMSFD